MLYNVISFHIERNCGHWYASLSARCPNHCDMRSVSSASQHPVIIKYQREINTLYHPNQTITLKYPKHCCHQYDTGDTSCQLFEIDLSYRSSYIQGVEHHQRGIKSNIKIELFYSSSNSIKYSIYPEYTNYHKAIKVLPSCWYILKFSKRVMFVVKNQFSCFGNKRYYIGDL